MSSGERAAFAGQITDLPVSELLRTVVHGKQTGLARFQTNLGSATLWFREGSIVDADMGRFHMGAAVRRLLTADTGTFEIEFKPISRRRLIKEDTQELLDSVDPPSPPEMMRSGPRRARPAPGWTPTAGGKGATREGGEPEPVPERRPTPPPETRPALGTLGSVKRRATDKSLHAVSSAGPEEDDDLTRVAKSPATLPTFPASWAAPAETALPTPPAIDLDRSAAAPAIEVAPPPASASATAMGYTAHALAEAAQSQAAAPSERPSIASAPRRTQMGVPQLAPPSKVVARTVAPSEPTRPSSTAKMPVQEPSPERQRRKVTVEGKTSDGSPVEVEAEEISDPIPVGTTWAAPSHLSEPAPAKAESESQSGRTGEIRRRGGAVDRTVVPFAPSLPFQKTKPDPGGTVTDGFRPILPGDGPSKPITDSYPTVGSAASERRVSSIASSIGLDPSASGVGLEAEAVRGAAAPAVVGRYEVLLRIARGGMGTVYLCRVTGAGGFRRLFALKVIRDHLSRNAEYVTMLLQEARIASRLHHPNVVGIVDIGTLANQHYLVMDYVEGCTFSELLKVHRKSRPPQLVIPIVLDALTGLHAAHTLVNDDGSPLTLVHCDFSPQNILVGTNGICRITDFGIARASNALPEKSSITRGKPAYLAPEQVLGRPFDHRADVFAAGVVLWNALTGEQLFGGETPEETLEKVLSRPIQPPSAVGLRPPRSLDRVVMRALQRDPDTRYQTAEEMLIDLRRVAITEDLLAPASEVARWVTDTFGTQLELRRQAAGITAKPGPTSGQKDSREISVPELGLGPDASATHTIAPTGGDTHADDLESRTVMLHTSGDVMATAPDAAALNRRQRNDLFGLAAAMAGIALALAFMRPGWLLGGFLDEDGTYFEPDAPVILPTEVVDAGETKTDGKPKDGKAVDGKAVDGKAVDGKAEPGDDAKTELVDEAASDAKAEPPPPDGKAIDEAVVDGNADAKAIDDAPSKAALAVEGAGGAASEATAPTPSDARRPTPPPKPDRTKPKTAKPRPEPAPDPDPDPDPAAPAPPDPPPEDAAPEPEPAPPPKPKTADEPALPQPPDLKELLDG